MSRELIQVIQQISRERQIEIDVLIEAIESAFLSAAKKRFAQDEVFISHLNRETGDINLFKVFEVVKNVSSPKTQLDIKEALKYCSDAKIGSSVEVMVEMSDFSRIAAQTAKHVILQKVKEAERDNIYNEYKDKKGCLINGIFDHREKGNAVIDLGKIETVIADKELISHETFKRGERIRAYIIDVTKSPNKGPQLILSRTHPGFVAKLFEMEVPEISEGIVVIKGVVREAGERTKIAVHSKDKDIDPVGACVGIRGSRVQSIVRELKGEKIDIIRWSEDPSIFIQNALSPAEILKINFHKTEGMAKLVVSDKFLSLAIGKKGQNARLASKLTGWKIDIKSETETEEEWRMEKIKLEQARIDLTQIPGIGPSVAAKLLDIGIRSLKELVNTDISSITNIQGIGKLKAAQILKNAEEYLNRISRGGGKE
ncbi:transcription termination/antitermination protein NusA [bacterium]|nr:transcription termination/antitermination protein NusA [bacterium]